MEVDGIDPARIPTHVAAVMDGNGRWATQRGLKRTEGHAAGEEALFDAVEGALELGVRWLTVYAFSTENWRRPADEVRYLMDFNESLLLRRRDELNDRDVRMRFIGRRNWRVPKRIIKRMDESIALTEKNRTMTLTIAFNYGGRAEIIDAVRALVEEGAKPPTDHREGHQPAPLRPRHARPRPLDPHLGGAPHLQLPAVGDRVLRAGVHRRALARLPPGAPLRRPCGSTRTGTGASVASRTAERR